MTVMDVLIVTPVKDSPETTKQTIKAVSFAKGDFEYAVFDDFSKPETKIQLRELRDIHPFRLIDLEEMTSNPSPNYKIILQKAREMAMKINVPLLLIESDVIIREDTVVELLRIASGLRKPGLVGAVTVDQSGHFNFPYAYLRQGRQGILKTRRSISFCCTLISREFLSSFDFGRLSGSKDWYDVFISRQSRKAGFNNYLAVSLPVLHQPHSSRPWKQLKYTNPLKYYFYKFLKHRDRI